MRDIAIESLIKTSPHVAISMVRIAGRSVWPESDLILSGQRRSCYVRLMNPDEEAALERAWLARDAAFDGRFFIGVRTTGVYCRCVCPVRLPLRRNVEFLPSAAAAEAAGFRPCLRCRPETAPFCPAWKGSLATVERAARLIIKEGALDGEDCSVDGLAERLGVTGRHLRRLFLRHWGASPSMVARTARVQRAKRLLDTTDLPVAEIALAAGFGSLRRFNVVFADVYGRRPNDMRRSSRAGSGTACGRRSPGPL